MQTAWNIYDMGRARLEKSRNKMNKCQGCENGYSIDLLIPNELWDQIKPDGKAEGAGLLCGSCIIKRMEKILVYACYKIVLVK